MEGRAASIVRQEDFEEMIAAGLSRPVGAHEYLLGWYPGRCPGLRGRGPLARRRRVFGKKTCRVLWREF